MSTFTSQQNNGLSMCFIYIHPHISYIQKTHGYYGCTFFNVGVKDSSPSWSYTDQYFIDEGQGITGVGEDLWLLPVLAIKGERLQNLSML